jgi:hypothetical protein
LAVIINEYDAHLGLMRELLNWFCRNNNCIVVKNGCTDRMHITFNPCKLFPYCDPEPAFCTSCRADLCYNYNTLYPINRFKRKNLERLFCAIVSDEFKTRLEDPGALKICSQQIETLLLCLRKRLRESIGC